MAPVAIPSTVNLGFLTVLNENGSYTGGYLVTNQWGRPLEFRLSTKVQPNRIQQILYGGTLQSYICAEVIGKTLVEKTSLSPPFMITDCGAALDLRQSLDVPLFWLAHPSDPSASSPAAGCTCVRPSADGRSPAFCHARFPEDVAVVRELLERLDSTMDLTEPFTRIRDAMSEARKIGATSRN